MVVKIPRIQFILITFMNKVLILIWFRKIF